MHHFTKVGIARTGNSPAPQPIKPNSLAPPDSCAPRPAPGGDVWGDRPWAGAELAAAGGVPVPSDGDLDRAGLALPVRGGAGG